MANIAAPDAEAWLGFGRIYEQFGVNTAVIQAYEKVEKPQGQMGPDSTYLLLLAQSRLRALQAVMQASQAQ